MSTMPLPAPRRTWLKAAAGALLIGLLMASCNDAADRAVRRDDQLGHHLRNWRDDIHRGDDDR